jgi:hypothetical protein
LRIKGAAQWYYSEQILAVSSHLLSLIKDFIYSEQISVYRRAAKSAHGRSCN